MFNISMKKFSFKELYLNTLVLINSVIKRRFVNFYLFIAKEERGVFNFFLVFLNRMKAREIFFIIVFIIFSYGESSVAQEFQTSSEIKTTTDIIPLTIGDIVPEELWNHVLKINNSPSNHQILQLKELKAKKLIILDFWATWCGSCIGSIKKYMSSDFYQDKDIAFLGVTYQDNADVLKFNNRYEVNFATIVEDKVLKKYFPHRIIPHIVVLKDNRVLAIAQPEILNQKAIQSLKDGIYEKGLVKADILDYDPRKEIAQQNNIAFQKATLARTTVLGPIVGLHGISSYKKNEQSQRILITNKSLQLAMYELLDSYWHNRIFLDVKNESQFNYYGQEQDLALNQWLAKYAVGVESVTPLTMPKSEMKKNAMIALLNAKGYDFQITRREVPCYVIYASRHEKIKVNNTNNITFSELLHQLNYQPIDMPRKPIYVIDSSIRPQDSLYISHDRLGDAEYLHLTLTKSGFTIKRELRKQPVIEVSERREL